MRGTDSASVRAREAGDGGGGAERGDGARAQVVAARAGGAEGARVQVGDGAAGGEVRDQLCEHARDEGVAGAGGVDGAERLAGDVAAAAGRVEEAAARAERHDRELRAERAQGAGAGL